MLFLPADVRPRCAIVQLVGSPCNAACCPAAPRAAAATMAHSLANRRLPSAAHRRSRAVTTCCCAIPLASPGRPRVMLHNQSIPQPPTRPGLLCRSRGATACCSQARRGSLQRSSRCWTASAKRTTCQPGAGGGHRSSIAANRALKPHCCRQRIETASLQLGSSR